MSTPTLPHNQLSPGRIPALDGVRGLAIAMVVIMHTTVIAPLNARCAAVEAIGHAGWMGVDLFFVLSGFLITGILFDSRNDAHYFRNFYARRGLRIFPLYYAFVAMFVLVLPQLGGDHPERGPTWCYWLFYSNFTHGFAGEQRHRMLDVLWSLSVEEHFYLVWPLCVFRMGRANLMRLCGAIVGVAIVARCATVASGLPWLATYSITPCRMDALTIGAFVALSVRGAGGVAALLPLARRAAVVSTAMIIACFAWHRGPAWHGGPGQTVGYTAIAILFASMLTHVLVVRPGSGWHRFFTTPALLTLGRYSYAIYLFHYPLATLLGRYLCDSTGVRPLMGSALFGQAIYWAACFAASLAAALVSWNLLEKHCLKLKDWFAPAAHRPERAALPRPRFAHLITLIDRRVPLSSAG
jgi:peptidoglycan/LPS O-acetylase OafA/YrhL